VLSQHLRQLANEKPRQAREHMLVLGSMTASERITSFLLQLADHPVARAARIDLPMSHRDIADYLGLTMETIGRAEGERHDQDGHVVADRNSRPPDARVDGEWAASLMPQAWISCLGGFAVP
jgi:CRP-like cAMP-binding protein